VLSAPTAALLYHEGHEEHEDHEEDAFFLLATPLQLAD
jgi:hypothetical protein